MEHLHEKNMIHADQKSGTILLNWFLLIDSDSTVVTVLSRLRILVVPNVPSLLIEPLGP